MKIINNLNFIGNSPVEIDILYNEEDFWLTQKSMSQLFNVEVNTINYHLKEIFETEECFENAIKKLYSLIEKIKSFRGKLNISVDEMFNCYSTLENALSLHEKLYGYAMLKYHQDMSNQDSIKLYKTVFSLGKDSSSLAKLHGVVSSIYLLTSFHSFSLTLISIPPSMSTNSETEPKSTVTYFLISKSRFIFSMLIACVAPPLLYALLHF